MRKLLPAVILGCLLLSPAGWAGKFYVGVGAGRATLETRAGGTGFDLDDTGYRLFAGFRMASWLSIEGGYTDLGNLSGSHEEISYEAQSEMLAAHAVGVLPISPRARIFAKIGLASWDTRSTVTSGETTDRRDANGIDLSYGFGLGYDLTRRLGLRLDWETCDFDNTEEVRFLSLGAQLNF